jgi:hypothetical protein
LVAEAVFIRLNFIRLNQVDLRRGR